MGFNRKSDAGPFEGQQSEQRKVTKIHHIQQPEVSVPTHLEQPEVSVPTHLEQPEISVPIHLEQLRLLPVMNYNRMGINTNHDIRNPLIMELYGADVSMTHNKIRVSPTVEFEKDELEDGITSYELDYVTIPANLDLSYSFINILGYKHNSSNVLEDSGISEFTFPIIEDYELFNEVPTSILYPNLHTLINYKMLSDNTTGAKKGVGAIGPIEIPIITTKVGAGSDEHPVSPSNITDGNDLPGYYRTSYLKVSRRSYYDMHASVNSTLTSAFVPDAANSIGAWGDGGMRKRDYQFKGFRTDSLAPAIDGAYTDAVIMITYEPNHERRGRNYTIISGSSYNGIREDVQAIVRFLPMTQKIEEVTDNLQALSIILIPSWADYITGLDLVSGNVWHRIMNDIDTLIASYTDLKDIRIVNKAVQRRVGGEWSGTAITNASGFESAWCMKTDSGSATSLPKYKIEMFLPTNNTEPFNVTPYFAFRRDGGFWHSNKNKGTGSNISVYGGCVSGNTWSLGDVGNPVANDQTRWLYYLKVSTDSFSTAAYGLEFNLEIYNDANNTWVNQLISSSPPVEQSPPTPQGIDCCILEDTRSLYSSKIIDPSLISGSYIGSWFLTVLHDDIKGGKFKVRNLQTALSVDSDNDIKIESGTSIINRLDDDVTQHFVSCDVYDDGSKELNIAHLNIKTILQIDTDRFLTIVSPILNRYYFGILDTANQIHYSPSNIFYKLDEDTKNKCLFSYLPLVTDVKLIEYTETNFDITISSYHINEAGAQVRNDLVYLSFSKISKFETSVFINNEHIKSMYVHEQYSIDKETGTSLSVDNPGTSGIQLGLPQQFTFSTSLNKQLTVLDCNGNMVIPLLNNEVFSLNVSPRTMIPSYSMLPKSIAYIYDAAAFSVNTTKHIIPYPTNGYCSQNCDMTDMIYAEIPTGDTNNQKINRLLYYHGNIMLYDKTNNVNIGKDDKQRPGSIVLVSLPGIDPVIMSYAILPEKFYNSHNITDLSLLDNIGNEAVYTNEKSYVSMNQNIYESSAFALVRANDKPILGHYGTIYASGMYIIVSDNEGSYVYAVDRFSKASLIKMIPDVCIAKPLVFPAQEAQGYDLYIIGRNGIHSLSQGPIVEYDFPITNSITKPIEGVGFLMMGFSYNKTEEVGMLIPDGGVDKIFYFTEGTQDTVPLIDIPYGNLLFYMIYENKIISVMGYSNETSQYIAENKVISHNLYNARLSSYNVKELEMEQGATDEVECASYYAALSNSSYHSVVSVESNLFSLVNEENLTGYLVEEKIYTIGMGSVNVLITDGSNTLLNETKSISATSTTEAEETIISAGYIPYKNNKYKITITPTTANSISLQDIKYVVEFDNEEEYNVV